MHLLSRLMRILSMSRGRRGGPGHRGRAYRGRGTAGGLGLAMLVRRFLRGR